MRDAAGRMLTVRKRGTTRFMLPGGKPEPDESATDAAIRECAEELGVTLDRGGLQEMGRFRAPAANEHRLEVEATVFEYPLAVAATPSAEIEELRWLDPARPALPTDLAPLLTMQVLPALGWSVEVSGGRNSQSPDDNERGTENETNTPVRTVNDGSQASRGRCAET
ncbi:NUDIX domain-containing protein [Mycobacterium haemophilum DSM 44634]|nr:NUDIX domain-containing protein [Mycobacterium haemophilum DSM 44634]